MSDARAARPGVALLRSARSASLRLSTSDLVRKVGQTLAVRIVSLAVSTATTILVARTLGPAGRGLYGVAGAVGATGVAFANLGLQSSNTYYVSRDRRLLPPLAANSALASFIVAPALAVVAWIAFVAVPDAAPVRGRLLWLALLAIPLGLGYLLFQNLLLGLQDIRGFNFIELATRLGGLAVLVAAIAAGGRSPSLLFAAALVPSAAAALWAWLRTRGFVDRPPRPSLALLRSTLAYGLRAYLAAFFGFMLLRSDLLVVKYRLGATETGYYSIAVSMADMLYIIPSVVGLVLFPRLAAMAGANAARLALRVTLAVAAAMALAAAILAVVARPLIVLVFGQAFAPATTPFLVLAAAMIFYGTNNIVSNYAAASGYPWFAVWIWGVALALNVALNLVLIHPLGITGSALASLSCYALVMVAQSLYFLRKDVLVARET